jgi:hypothetical protein
LLNNKNTLVFFEKLGFREVKVDNFGCHPELDEG